MTNTANHTFTLSLARNNAGHAMVCLIEFNEIGYGIRDTVLAGADGLCDRIIVDRFNRLTEVMGDNVTTEVCESFALDTPSAA